MTDSGKSKWISVEDNLPENGDAVLAFDSHGIHASYRSGNSWFDDWGNFRLYQVSHWQPLPDPPTIEPVAIHKAPANEKPSVTTGDSN